MEMEMLFVNKRCWILATHQFFCTVLLVSLWPKKKVITIDNAASMRPCASLIENSSKKGDSWFWERTSSKSNLVLYLKRLKLKHGHFLTWAYTLPSLNTVFQILSFHMNFEYFCFNKWHSVAHPKKLTC